MVTPRRRTPAALAVLAGVAAVAACTSPPVVDVETPPAPAPRLAVAECQAPPPAGRIERAAADLSFSRGELRMLVTKPGAEPECVLFTKSGNARPDVPPESLLFTFAGPDGQGAQLEFLVVDLTGGILPIVHGDRPPIPGLANGIPAQAGISLDGNYFHSDDCRLQITAMSPIDAAGAFTCDTAVQWPVNPLSPADEVALEDETAGPSAESTTAADDAPDPAPPTVSLSGWYFLTP